jgi:phenylpyruvate tautomerase PptA (4-oxalocrotonate tautomerase family)
VFAPTYHEEFGLGRYLIQVIFYEIAKDDRYIAGEPAQPDVVWIRCDVREGRNEEMKARLLHRVQQGVAKTANVPEEDVWFYLCNLPSMNIMEWGTSCRLFEQCPMTISCSTRSRVLCKRVCGH